MVSTSKTKIIEIYLESHPNAPEKEIYAHVNGKGKSEITLPYCRKIAHLWRKKKGIVYVRPKNAKQSRSKTSKTPSQKSTQDDQEVPLNSNTSGSTQLKDAELRNILDIMQIFQHKGLPIPKLPEIHAYLKDRGAVTNAEEEIKSNLKLMSPQELILQLLPERNLQKDALEEN